MIKMYPAIKEELNQYLLEDISYYFNKLAIILF